MTQDQIHSSAFRLLHGHSEPGGFNRIPPGDWRVVTDKMDDPADLTPRLRALIICELLRQFDEIRNRCQCGVLEAEVESGLAR